MSGRGVVVTVGTVERSDVSEYSVVEDSTPLDPADNTGGFGQINVTVNSNVEGIRRMGDPLTLTDGSLGETTGTIRAVGDDAVAIQFTANSRLANLAVERTIQPFVGNLADGIEYHLGLCGITSGIVIDSSFSAVNVKIPGGRENVYDRMKRMAAAYNFELSLVSNNVVVRPPRQRIAVNYRDADGKRTWDQSNFAQSVQGYYYNSYSGTNIAYPLHGITDDAQVYQVDANETLVYDIPLDASLGSVVQPTCVATVSRNDMSASQYSVVGSDGLAVPVDTWLKAGGLVSVAIGEDTQSLIVKITGANIPSLSPFRIAVQEDENEYYSSLRVRGDGVFWDKKLFTLYMNDDQDVAPDEVGTVVDNPFMETFDQLYHRLLRTAAHYGTDTQHYSVTSGGINRLGESGSAAYPTIADVDAMFPGATIDSLAASLGPTIADWNAALFAEVSSDFTNQAFGNVSGARVLHKGSYYRIRTATIRPLGLDYTAERDNIIEDVYRTGETIAQWNARWSGKIIRDVNIAPID